MSKRYSETEIANMIEEFGAQINEAPAPIRRTRIVEESTAPVTGYRVSIDGTDIDVEASDMGDAVLRALALPETPARLGGYVFLWRYSVTDADGVTLEGHSKAMRALLEAARMRGK